VSGAAPQWRVTGVYTTRGVTPVNADALAREWTPGSAAEAWATDELVARLTPARRWPVDVRVTDGEVVIRATLAQLAPGIVRVQSMRRGDL